MGFLTTRLPIVGFALAALLGMACINLFLENSKLKSINSVLTKDLERAREKNELLTKDYVTVKNNLNACDTSLALQNQAIKAAKAEIKPVNSQSIERVKKIYIKDKSCESELAAYKALFADDEGKK